MATIKLGLGVAAIVAPIVGAAVLWWGSRTWVRRPEFHDLEDRLEREKAKRSGNRRAIDSLLTRMSLAEQEAKNTSARIREQIIQPLHSISEQLTVLSRGQTNHAVVLGRMEESVKGLTLSVDDLRKRIERQEKRGAA